MQIFKYLMSIDINVGWRLPRSTIEDIEGNVSSPFFWSLLS